MIALKIKYHELQFKKPAGTSRGILRTKPSWFFKMTDTENTERVGFGECSIIPGLSFEDQNDLENGFERLLSTIERGNNINLTYLHDLVELPAMRFALETCMRDFHTTGTQILYPGSFTKGRFDIPINGLIWMGAKEDMFIQVKEKIENGWTCIKLKIGAIDFEDELDLIKYIRQHFTPADIMIRVDANGAFSPQNALERLKKLAKYSLHSIEQPIATGQYDEMALLCEKTPLPIALDEELIGIHQKSKKTELLKIINPQFIILKPSLVGGLSASEEWINIAKDLGIGFWITSALESNIGLNAIAQWTAHNEFDSFQGLGTGQLYTNNIDSPLEIRPGRLHYNPSKNWDVNILE
jgi:o-succinylbenzoate synthase